MTIIYHKCCICGDNIGNSWGDYCPSCPLHAALPGWYAGAEGYIYIPAYGHANATRKPMTGKAILDCPSGHRLSRHAPMGAVPRDPE